MCVCVCGRAHTFLIFTNLLTGSNDNNRCYWWKGILLDKRIR